MQHLRTASLLPLTGIILFAVQGCAEGPRLKHAGRTEAERQKVVTPAGRGDKPGSVRRNNFFDYWNEQIIREDIAVSTVFFGDSITERWDLAAFFPPGDGLIENRGVSGDHASRMIDRVKADVIQLRPRNVVILAGTNDVSGIIAANKSDEDGIREITTSLEALMTATRAAGINTLVCSILPTNSVYMRHSMRPGIRARINEKLKPICHAHGCAYVDYASAMSDANGELRKDLAPDGIHPNHAGLAIMTRVLREAMRAKGWHF